MRQQNGSFYKIKLAEKRGSFLWLNVLLWGLGFKHTQFCFAVLCSEMLEPSSVKSPHGILLICDAKLTQCLVSN